MSRVKIILCANCGYENQINDSDFDNIPPRVKRPRHVSLDDVVYAQWQLIATANNMKLNEALSTLISKYKMDNYASKDISVIQKKF